MLLQKLKTDYEIYCHTRLYTDYNKLLHKEQEKKENILDNIHKICVTKKKKRSGCFFALEATENRGERLVQFCLPEEF